MTQDTLNIILLISPLVVGGIIAAINSNEINDTTEKAEAWTRRTQSKVSLKNGFFNRYIINPIIWVIVKFCDWTDEFTHRGLKNGTRVAATLYFIAVWCLILYATFMIAAILAIAGLIIYVVFKVLINSNDDVRESYEKGSRIVGPIGSGKKINQETGVIQEDGFFGYTDTDQRIDPETGKVQTKGVFGWNDTDTKIDQETGNIQKDGFFGYSDTETRIDPETGIVQTKGFAGWTDTDERIEPTTGKHQEKTFFGWVDK